MIHNGRFAAQIEGDFVRLSHRDAHQPALGNSYGRKKAKMRKPGWRLLLLLFFGLSQTSAQAAAPLPAKIYLTVSGDHDLQQTTLTVFDATAGQEVKPLSQVCYAGICNISLAPGNYFLTLAKPGFWKYSTMPFSLYPGQVIHHQASLAKQQDRFSLSDVLASVSIVFVILGLFREQLIRAFVNYPKLSVELCSAPPHTHLAAMSWSPLAQHTAREPDQFDTLFCRVFVNNVGTGEVTDVEVFVSAIWDIVDGMPKPVLTFLPMNLRWANTWNFYGSELRIQNDQPLRKSRISSGVGRFVDLGFVIEPRARTRFYESMGLDESSRPMDGEPEFQFAFESFQTAIGRWSNKDYMLELALDGNNMETELFYIRINLQGKWIDGKGPEIFDVTPADRDLVKKAGKRPKKFHLYELSELGRKLRNVLLKRAA